MDFLEVVLEEGEGVAEEGERFINKQVTIFIMKATNKYIPLDTEEKLYELYVIKNMPLSKIALVYNCHGQTVSNNLRRYNIQRRKPNYKGGIKYANGYRLLRVPSHPRASNGYVPEHILIMEKKLGRYLKYYGYNNSKNEVVHHIDGNKLNQRINNLLIISSGKHIGIHNKIKNKFIINKRDKHGRFLNPLLKVLPKRCLKCGCMIGKNKHRCITNKRDKYGRFLNPLSKIPPKKCFNCGQTIGKNKHLCKSRKVKNKYRCCSCKQFLKKKDFFKDKTKKYGIDSECITCCHKGRLNLKRKQTK